ncbi:hypothetical protein Pint_18157 [Pistacia integerrima]|uniref:Uncharacterized protein n=1 Tax=Pistacia integerrima TaxID=434235 RepID=A0ACC0YY72_9ROSI|nr:hypothetical protein Pint_18157 [Pistacia integerrima]
MEIFEKKTKIQGASLGPNPGLEYDHYRESYPDAEKIVRSIMSRLIVSRKMSLPLSCASCFKTVSSGFVNLILDVACDASLFLDDSNGNTNHSIERWAVLHSTLKGFDKIDLIKAELERICSAVVSCADTLALATRDGILLGHTTLKKCQFIQGRLYNFTGTGKTDPTIAADFLNELRLNCQANNSSSSLNASEISSGSDFDTHYFRSLLRGKGLLFADQQLMADDKTATLVKAYTSGDGTIVRMDFARAMVKMSNLGSPVRISRSGQE